MKKGHNILPATWFFIPEASNHYLRQVSWLAFFWRPSRYDQWYKVSKNIRSTD